MEFTMPHAVPSLRVVAEIAKRDPIAEFLDTMDDGTMTNRKDSEYEKTEIEWVFPLQQIKCVTVAKHFHDFLKTAKDPSTQTSMVVVDCGGRGLYKFEVTPHDLANYGDCWPNGRFPFTDKKLKAKSYSVQFN
jgi:hypothetical protein